MKDHLESAHIARKDSNLSLRDIETRAGQARVSELCDCGYRLYYDSTTWARLYLESLVGRNQIINYFKQIPPALARFFFRHV